MNWVQILKKDTYPRNRNGERYMLKHSVWIDEANLDWEDGEPTIEEIEERIGRTLTKDDFMLYAPATWQEPQNKPTVFSRIGKEGIIEGITEFLKNPTTVMDNIPEEFRSDKIKEGYIPEVKEALIHIGENPEDYLSR